LSSPRPPRLVHVVSHGPHCLDGVAAAVAVARYRSTSEVRPYFSGNPKINEILCGLKIDEPLADQELWITDISWTAPEADAHLRRLAGRGLPIFWIDHHRTAIERLKAGSIDVAFTHRIVDDRYAASRLVSSTCSNSCVRKVARTGSSRVLPPSCAWRMTTTAGSTRSPDRGSSH
jgi:oligoribonuclease NrnB/cAMP/cGMP phosphodiesterase (DHH superfamily)